MIPDAVQDFGTIPVMPVLCGRCGKVLDEMSVDPVRGWVFYRPPSGGATRIARRRPRLSLRGARRPWRVSGDGLPGETMTYSCDNRTCPRAYQHTYDELRMAVLRAVKAGRSSVVFGRDL